MTELHGITFYSHTMNVKHCTHCASGLTRAGGCLLYICKHCIVKIQYCKAHIRAPSGDVYHCSMWQCLLVIILQEKLWEV